MAQPVVHQPREASLADRLGKLADNLDKLTSTFSKPSGSVADSLRNMGATPPGGMGPLTQLQSRMSGKGGAAVRAGGAAMQAFNALKGTAGAGGGGVGGLVGGLADKALTSGNPYAMAAGAVVKLGMAAVEGVQKLRNWNNELHEQNRAFAEYSASMAGVMAEDDARQMQLKREQGERRAGSAKELAEAKSRLDRQLAPIEDFFGNMKNKFAAGMSNILSGALEKLGIGGDTDEAPKDIGGLESMAANDWMAQIDSEYKLIYDRRPARMR